MIRGVARRLEKLEAISAAVNDSYPRSHLIRFVTPEHEVVSTLLIESGKPWIWTHLRESPPSSDTLGNRE